MSTLKVQEAAPAKLAPLRLMEVPPAVAEIVPPPQVPVNPLGVETARPEGRVSVKPIPVRVVAALVFVMLKVRVVLPLRATVRPVNDFEIDGGVVAGGGKAILLTNAFAQVPAQLDWNGCRVGKSDEDVSPVT